MNTNCNNGNRKKFYKTVKPFFDRKENGSDRSIVLREHDQIIAQPKQICETFNPYYVSVTQQIG